MIDLARLQHIILVAREGSFVRAARAANLSQPALTRSVQATERQFGIRIFERSRTGAILTRAGLQFLALTEEFARRADTLETELRVISAGGSGAVSFGLGPLAVTLFLADTSDLLFRGTARAVVRVDNDSVLRRLLLDDEISFYIGGSWLGSSDFAVSSRLHVEVISHTPYALLAREGHPLAGRKDISRDDLRHYPLVGSSPIRRILDESALAVLGLSRPVLEVDNYPVLIEIIRTSDAILLASPFLFRSSWGAGLTSLAVEMPADSTNIAACLVTIQGRELTPAARVIADRFRFLLSKAEMDWASTGITD